jgi:hypothetical protein
MEDDSIFYGHFVYFTAIWYFLGTFDIFCGNLVNVYRFGKLHKEKSGNTVVGVALEKRLGCLGNHGSHFTVTSQQKGIQQHSGKLILSAFFLESNL